MPGFGRSLAAIAILTAAAASTPAQFTPGNVVVLRVGDGSTIPGSNTIGGTLVELSATTGAPTGYTVALPTATVANAGGVTFASTTPLSTFLHRSADGAFLTAIGYDTPIGTNTSTASASTTINRTIARVDASGVATTQRLTDTTFSGNTPQAVVSDGTQYWLSGNASATADRGIRYASGPSATGSSQLVSANARDVALFGNRLYYSTSTSVFGISQSPPPTSGSPASVTIQSNMTNVNGFVLFDRSPTVGDPSLGGIDTLYVASGSAIQKLEYAGGAWLPRGNYISTQLNGGTLFGLTGQLNGGTVELYATDANGAGRLAKIVDGAAFGTNFSGSNAWGSAYTPGANYTLRGVDFSPTPVPEPGAVLAIAAIGLGLVSRRAVRVRFGRVPR